MGLHIRNCILSSDKRGGLRGATEAYEGKRVSAMRERMRFNRRISIPIVAAFAFTMCFTGCANQTVTDYAKSANWAYLESDKREKKADVFFICPTVYFGESGSENMSLSDDDSMGNFLGAINMEKGIYAEDCRFFAPYYRQAGLCVYELKSPDEQEKYYEPAYSDVKAAFEYYMEHYNQGADMCIRLMKDVFDNKEVSDRLVACYAIGWRFTEQEVAEYPQLKAAEGETDTGVIIAFNSEAESITESLMVPKGTKTFSINPLNWTTDGTAADRSLNKGACFTDYGGNIKSEIPELTGAYIDSVRGTLKVTDVTPKDYPPVLVMFESGIYHLYDYQFFYRNLQENVSARINAFVEGETH